MNPKKTILVLLAVLAWFAFQKRLTPQVTSSIRYGIFPGEDIATADEIGLD